MMNGFIQLKTLLEVMDSFDDQGKPVRFQIKFVTADRTLRKGGEIIEIKDGRKCVGYRDGKVVFDTRNLGQTPNPIKKDPNHTSNSTRNILCPNGRIRKTHIRLIIEFNYQKVFF